MQKSNLKKLLIIVLLFSTIIIGFFIFSFIIKAETHHYNQLFPFINKMDNNTIIDSINTKIKRVGGIHSQIEKRIVNIKNIQTANKKMVSNIEKGKKIDTTIVNINTVSTKKKFFGLFKKKTVTVISDTIINK